jgi:hypothetical protein
MGLDLLSDLFGGGSASSSAASSSSLATPFEGNTYVEFGGSGSQGAGSGIGPTEPTSNAVPTSTATASTTPASNGSLVTPGSSGGLPISNTTLTYILILGAAVAAFFTLQKIK